MSLFDLGARLVDQRAEFLRLHREAVTRDMERIDQLMAAVGEKIANEIRNPNPWKYVGDGAWVDMTVTHQSDLELKA